MDDSQIKPIGRSRHPTVASSSVSKTVTAYEEIREDIIRGNFPPGMRLSELALTERYQRHTLSRTPIREALIRLEQDGLVERRGNSAWVRDRTPEEVIDIAQATAFVEGAIARCAAERRSDTDLARFQTVLERGDTVSASDIDEVQAANQSFHMALAIASRNDSLREVQTRLAWQVAQFPSTTLSYPGRWDAVRKEHAEIVTAVRDRDPAEAERLARDHMLAAINVRLILMASSERASAGVFQPGPTVGGR